MRAALWVQGAHLNPELLSNGRQKPVAKARGLIEVSGVGVSLFLWCLWPDQDPFRDKPLCFGGGGYPCCSAAIESHRVWTRSRRWARGRLNRSEPIEGSG